MISAATAIVTEAPSRRRAELPVDDVERILGALSGLRYGAVTVIVQDGVIVQVERTEKLRVTRRAEPRSCA
jgi:hypothetical protein